MSTYTYNYVNYSYTVGTQSASVSGSPKATGDLIILESFIVNTVEYVVTNINVSALESCSGLTSVTIPSSITSIGNYAFSGCTRLTNIICYAYLSNFGDGFFGVNNANLQITFDYVGAIPDGACNGRILMTGVTIGPNITSIGTSSFQGCSSLTSITIPNSVTSIENVAFGNCYGLTSITIPSSCTGVENGAFQYCSSLKNIICNAYLSNFSDVFNSVNNAGLQITFDYVGAIPDGACDGRNLMTGVTIGPNINSIGNSSFQGCSSLTSITIPSSCTSIGDTAFELCANLLNVYFAGSIPTIEANNFTPQTGATAYYVIGTNISNLTAAMFSFTVALTQAEMNVILEFGPSPFPSSPPLIISATGANGTATIYFTQGTNSSASITNYSYSTNGTDFTDLSPAQIVSPLSITGLMDNSTYSFTIRAYNGLASANSNTVNGVFINYPQPTPMITSATGSNGTATINFDQDTNVGASAITNYSYSYSENSGPFTSFANLSPAQITSPLSITGLTNGSKYSFTIIAFNGLTSVHSNTSAPVFINSPPIAPVITSATGLNTVATINFTQEINGSAYITNYSYSTNGTDFTNLNPAQTQFMLSITGLMDNSTYSFTIRAYNGLYSTNSNTVTGVFINYPQPAPLIISATGANGTATINFEQETNSSLAITNYFYSTNGADFNVLSPAQITSPLSITGLTNGSTYSFTILAFNGIYSFSNTSAPVFINYPPFAPVILSASGANGTATINFTQNTNGSAPITNYYYVYSENNGADNVVFLSPSQTTSPLSITGLTNGSTYSFAIIAYNGLISNESNTINDVFMYTSQPAPVITNVTYVPVSAKVYFTQEINSSPSITGYKYSTDNGQTYTSISTTVNPLTINGLKQGTQHSFKLKANNGLDSDASNTFGLTFYNRVGKINQ